MRKVGLSSFACMRTMKKKCLFPKCKAVLSKYNTGRFCFLHGRVLHQNEILYCGGEFYKERVFSNGKSKRIRQAIAKVAELKEICQIS